MRSQDDRGLLEEVEDRREVAQHQAFLLDEDEPREAMPHEVCKQIRGGCVAQRLLGVVKTETFRVWDVQLGETDDVERLTRRIEIPVSLVGEKHEERNAPDEDRGTIQPAHARRRRYFFATMVATATLCKSHPRVSPQCGTVNHTVGDYGVMEGCDPRRPGVACTPLWRHRSRRKVSQQRRSPSQIGCIGSASGRTCFRPGLENP